MRKSNCLFFDFFIRFQLRRSRNDGSEVIFNFGFLPLVLGLQMRRFKRNKRLNFPLTIISHDDPSKRRETILSFVPRWRMSMWTSHYWAWTFNFLFRLRDVLSLLSTAIGLLDFFTQFYILCLDSLRATSHKWYSCCKDCRYLLL